MYSASLHNVMDDGKLTRFMVPVRQPIVRHHDTSSSCYYVDNEVLSRDEL